MRGRSIEWRSAGMLAVLFACAGCHVGPASAPTPAGSTTTTTGSASVSVSAMPDLVLRGDSAGVITPSRKVACEFSSEGGASLVRCDAAQAAWHVEHPPVCPDGNYGDSADLSSTTAASLGCHTDTVFTTGLPVLENGRTATFRDLRCTSAAAGMTCRNSAGQGFMVSPRTYRFF